MQRITSLFRFGNIPPTGFGTDAIASRRLRMPPLASRWSVRLATTLFLAVAALFPASAHHSFAMFDRNRPTTIQGVVSRFAWTNPHVFIAVKALDKRHVVTTYAIEAASISILTRNGWKAGSVKAGEPVRLTFYPLKNGQPGGLLVQVQLKSGAILKQ